MKKYLLLLFSLLVLQTVSAQQYYPMLDSVNTWRYIGNGLTVVRPHDIPDISNCSYPFMADYGTSSMYTTRDTVINSIAYKILDAAPDWSAPCTYGYLREDTALRKIYFLDINGGPEFLLYDFSMQIGDTMTINFIYGSGGGFPDGLYHLNSITSINTISGQRRVFNLQNNTCTWCDSLSWIESVGNPYDLIYPYSSNWYGNWFNCPGPQHHMGHFMSCFTHGEEVYVDSCAAAEASNNSCYLFIDSCSYYNICGSVPEINPSSFTISPNPAHKDFTITSNYALHTGKLEIFNVLGEKVYQQTINKRNVNVSCSVLMPGIYFVRLYEGDKMYAQKLVIQ